MINLRSVPLQTFLAMSLGIVVGFFFGPKLTFLGLFSQFLVWIIKTVALPLVFFSILDGFIKSEFRSRGFLWMLLISGFNALCAISIALTLSNTFVPGRWLPSLSEEKTRFTISHSWLLGLRGQLNGSRIFSHLTGTSLMIILALFLGMVLYLFRRTCSEEKQKWLSFLSLRVEAILRLLFWLIDRLVLFLPLAVFCAVVKSIGVHGFSLGKGLLAYFLSCAFGMALHILIVYQSWIRWAGRISLSFFWKVALEPALYAFGINSSLASLPITLKALEKLKVSPASARLSSCVGTNFNNDGILLYEVMAALFIIQSYQIPIPLASQIIIALISVVACIGVAGIPEAGIISLTIVLSSIGLPAETIPVLLTIDWVLARMRSFTNVLGDITVGVALDNFTSQGRFLSKPQLLK